MKQESTRCCGCGYFSAYYTMGCCCLLREKNGYCHKHEKTMQKSDSCDQCFRRRTSKKVRTMIAVNSIPEIYNKIAVIEQILKEELELRNIGDETDN